MRRGALHLYIYDDDACTYFASYDTNDFKTTKHSHGPVLVCGDVIEYDTCCTLLLYCSCY
jgi:hypothetical protein